MNGTHTRLAILLALSAMALVACGGSSTESPLSPGGAGDAASFTALSNGSGNGGAETPAGDGVCDGTAQGNGPGNGPGDGTCDGSGPGDGTCDATSPDGLQAILVEALQEEYKAEWTYRRVLADFGDVAPFSVIADSEARHVEAILRLFARREWTAPESAWTRDNVATFDTLAAACAGGVAVEIEDGALYERFLSRDDLPQDTLNVFTNLQAVSLNNHLPAFQRCQ